MNLPPGSTLGRASRVGPFGKTGPVVAQRTNSSRPTCARAGEYAPARGPSPGPPLPAPRRPRRCWHVVAAPLARMFAFARGVRDRSSASEVARKLPRSCPFPVAGGAKGEAPTLPRRAGLDRAFEYATRLFPRRCAQGRRAGPRRPCAPRLTASSRAPGLHERFALGAIRLQHSGHFRPDAWMWRWRTRPCVYHRSDRSQNGTGGWV